MYEGKTKMTIPTADQEALIRFAFRLYSTGNTYGAPAKMVSDANSLIHNAGIILTAPEVYTASEFRSKAIKAL